MNYNHVNTAVACPYHVYEALRDALAIRSTAFANQGNMDLSASFLNFYPPSRPAEPLSGLWDRFDPYGLGYRKLEWRNPNIQVTWCSGYAYLHGDRVCMERALEILRHICRDQLPLVIEWASIDHQGRPEFMVSKVARVTHDDVTIVSSAATAASWRAEMVKPQMMIGNQASDQPIVGNEHYIDIFLAEELEVDLYVDRYGAALNAVLRKSGLGHVGCSGDWTSGEYGDDAPDVSSEVLVIVTDLDQALPVIRDVLIAAGCRVGCQLQYEGGRKLLFETYEADGWSSPRVAAVIDNGRAHDGEVWIGGVPA